MTARTLRVFDDHVPAGAGVQLSSTELHEILGRADALALHVIVDDVTTEGSFDLFVEHSADGWRFSHRTPPPHTAGNGDVTIATLAVGSKHQRMWADACVDGSAQELGPLLPYVRVNVNLGDGAAHVVVMATMRDGAG